ncbi:hypothetical protein M2323_000333 [Rhodoblastus acidophilus]|uniref:sigma-70 family RNA polymerase sigma factor n=1 Tax=Rhodoblastus acidophilus TaxID=1074 RepID=UPI002224C33F|nr:sigma-70 family RNA polymerase sigma factor [Rhodoblastus acidophilus]MCW2282572.1 hypothetical protein [Rhodoblastus acidophilus]MCW2331433.1 hypothetical protein [Rhodoblastus acidophilus]
MPVKTWLSDTEPACPKRKFCGHIGREAKTGMVSTSDADEVGQTDDEVDFLDAEEAHAAIRSLSADEKGKLMAMEARFLAGTGRQRGELFRESVCRTILGKRRCPRDVPFIAFMIETMRSIASHDREHQKKMVVLDEDRMSQVPAVIEPSALVSRSLDPEQHLLEKERPEDKDTVEIIAGHFQGDDQCQMLILGLSGGLRGKELREFVGVDQARIDYLHKKIRRRMLKLYPYGWKQ